MKKILFLLLFVSAVSVNAQSFDETDLTGTWITTGFTYPAYEITNIESITFGDDIYSYDKDSYPYDKGYKTMSGFLKNLVYTSYSSGTATTKTVEVGKIFDYFISNNNKLHIIYDDDFTLHFIIEELSATTLKVKTYDGQSFSFAKDNSSSAINSISNNRSADESTYNLSGQKVENITANGIYIQNGQKKVIKK